MSVSEPRGVPGTDYEFQLLDEADELSAAAVEAVNNRDFDALVDIVADQKKVDDLYDQSRIETTWAWAQRKGWEQ